MKKTLFLLLAFSILACSKENDNNIVQSHGTKLISLETINSSGSKTQNFHYDENGLLTKVNNEIPDRRFEFEYSDGKLKQYTTFDDENNRLFFRDSIAYNSKGQIETIYNFSINAGQDIPLHRVYEYDYDTDGKVSKKSNYFVSIQEYAYIEKYHWENGNIVLVEISNGANQLEHEYFYTYDDKINYKKSLPLYIKDPLNQTENNPTQFSAKDYTGLLDLVCYPCDFRYKYNLDDMPVEWKGYDGWEMKIEYE